MKIHEAPKNETQIRQDWRSSAEIDFLAEKWKFMGHTLIAKHENREERELEEESTDWETYKQVWDWNGPKEYLYQAGMTGFERNCFFHRNNIPVWNG